MFNKIKAFYDRNPCYQNENCCGSERTVLKKGGFFPSPYPYVGNNFHAPIINGKKVSKIFKLQGPHVAFGGAAVINNFEVVRYWKIPSKYPKKIIEQSREYKKAICIGTSDGAFYYETYHPNLKYIESGGEKIEYSDDITTKKIIDNSLLITVAINEYDSFNSFLNDRFSDKVNLVRGGDFFLDIGHQKATKLNGLKEVLKILRINEAEVMSIGDSNSDLEIIKSARIGVAMGNSPVIVKNAADFITTDNDNDGVTNAIRKYIEF